MALPEARNRSFDVDAAPRHWNGGRRAVTNFLDGLSIFFPVGERFFVASVNAHRSCVKDAELQRAVRAFCAQEGFHGREHDRYNAMLASRGYPVAALEAKVERLLARIERVLPPRARLAATCALEHFTSLMARALLGDPRTLEGADPAMAALWRWHAAEEIEHKTVAYDVFEAAGGTWAERCTIMALATVIFWAKVIEHQLRFMRSDGILASPREWASLLRFLFVAPGWVPGLVRPYFQYYRRGFHPSQIDDRALLDEWRTTGAA
jgi:predicted metal-dependent hydrolase